jgi:hypothetical protein
LTRTLAVLLALCCATPALAADHIDSPAAAADQSADITDLYAWHTDGGKLVAIIGFAGAGTTTTGATLDPEVLYGFHIDRDADGVADHSVWVRYAMNANGDWGMQVTNLPGADGVLVGPVGEAFGGGDAQAWTGVADDPFFMDFQGFTETVGGDGSIFFDPSRDFFAGLNVTAMTLEMDLAAAVDGADSIQVWATTSRL